jgi:glucose-1-phosphate thymidylyltransferase
LKALVLSGGEGTRLRPITHSLPKQLMPVANQPVLERVLGSLQEVGVTDVGLVVGGRQQAIRAAIGDGSRLGVRVTYLYQEQPRGLADCVRIAQPFLGGDDFVMYLGDNLLADGIGAVADRFRRQRPDALLTVHKVPDPSAFGVVELSSDGRVVRVVEKPRRPPTDLAVVGVYFFTAAVHAAVQAITPSARGELEISDAVQWLIDHGHTVEAGEYDGFWRDIGSVADALAGNRRLLSGLEQSVRGEVDAATVLSGPVVVSPGARVRRSRLVGPVMIGAGSVVEDSRLGPDTAIGRDCTIRVAGLADSIVLDAAVVHTRWPLTSSLIGRHTRVELMESMAGAHRLVLGDHCEIGVTA